MQRQSLGSPNPKLQSTAVGGSAVATPGGTAEREERRKSAAAVAALVVPSVASSEEAEIKTEKPFRAASPDRSIHFIPVLTFLCILLLYLMSHDLSADDLRSIHGGGVGVLRHAANSITTSVVERDTGGMRIASAGAGGVVSAVGNRRMLKTSEADVKLRHRRLETS